MKARASWLRRWRAASRVSASSRRTPAATALSPTTETRPISPVRRTCVPPQSSTEYGRGPLSPSLVPIETTRTSSPYFSPNSARAPDSRASSSPISRVTTGSFLSMMALAMSSTRGQLVGGYGLGWAKSKRSRSGATSEPFCATWSPSTSRSASCSRCVAEWLARIAGARCVVDLAAPAPRRPRAALVTSTTWANRSPSFFLTSRTATRTPGADHRRRCRRPGRRIRRRTASG